MRTLNGLKRIPQLLTMALMAVLVTAVIFLMNHVQVLLNSDVQINLMEVVTQNKDVITSKLMLEVNNLGMIANRIEDAVKLSGSTDDAELKKELMKYSKDHADENLYISNKYGTAFFSDGTDVDIMGRRYYRVVIQDIKNISDRIVSRHDGSELFVISVPLWVDNEIIGAVHKSYLPEKMYDLCSISLFSAQGYMYIINSQGYILLSSGHESYNQEADNYFRLLFAQGNQEASRKLQADISENRAGFMETVINGQTTFSAYTPINEVHDWYLISSVATQAVSPNANIVFQMFYAILSMVVVIFSLSMLYFFHYKNKQQKQLEYIAFVDTVTGGDTYNKFVEDLKKALKENNNYFLLKFDIDNFKYVNNFYGFDFGDRILRNIYQTMRAKLAQGESIARISSDHFIVLLRNASEERLSELLMAVQHEEGVQLFFSAGLYAISNPDESINLMVDKASAAALTAKGLLNKKIQLYSEQFDQQMIRNEQLKRAFKQALLDGELIPFYQPKVDVNSGELVGAEALARWRTREGKLVSPAEFIPMCEKAGLVVELDMAIFEQVLKFLRRNLDENVYCVPISVNFSRLHLPDCDFIEKILEKIRQYEVPPHLIEIELTESAIFDNHQTITEFINTLHKHDLLISMDDFGSGYSSLNMLKDVPIDVLKIDKDFLGESEDSRRRDIIFAAIARMARQLNIRVVVEGVETQENVELMKRFGCFIAQGYYFAKPMDDQAFTAIFKAGKV